jgi:hypothetical protein
MFRFSTMLVSVLFFSTAVIAGPMTDGVSATDQVGGATLNEPTEATPSQMAGIWYSLGVAQNDAGRIAVIKYAAKKYFFRALQVTALVEVVTDPVQRADLVVAMHARLTNPDQAERLLELLPEGALRQSTRQSILPTRTAAL